MLVSRSSPLLTIAITHFLVNPGARFLKVRKSDLGCCLLQTTLSCQVTNTSVDFQNKYSSSTKSGPYCKVGLPVKDLVRKVRFGPD